MVSFRGRQALLLGVMFASYMFVYLGRLNIAVVSPILISQHVLSTRSFGVLLSLGTILYAVGKFCSGFAIRSIGAKNVSVLCLFVAGLACAGFPYGSASSMTVLWCLNRFVQSFIWVAFLQLCAEWFPSTLRGSVVAVLTLSYLLADILGRVVFGSLLGNGHGWEKVFVLSGGLLITSAVLVLFTVTNSPQRLGYQRLGESMSTTGESGGSALSVLWLLEFWVVAFINGTGVFIRESMRDWGMMFLTEQFGLAVSAASYLLSFIPFAAVFSTLFIGCVSDKLESQRRGVLMLGHALLALISFAALTVATAWDVHSFALVTVLIFVASFGSYGVYNTASLLTLDVCSRRGMSENVGVFEGFQSTVGYLCAATGGVVIGEVLRLCGWVGFTCVMTAVMTVNLALVAYYAFVIEKS